MPNWTTEQAAAIEDRGGTLLVSASAGSGKTAVLVERAVGLITGPDAVDADRLLILTFSNAAAAELRSRIGSRLEKALAEDPTNSRLRRQRMLLQRANISTVSAFCMQLLRENFSALSIPPDFKVADEAVSYEIGSAVLGSVLDECYQNPAFCEFASVFGRARTDAAAGEAVLGLYGHLRALPFFETSLSEMCALYHETGAIADSVWGKELTAQALTALDSALSTCAAALDFIHRTPEIAGYADALNADADCFVRTRELLCAGRWDDARLTVLNYSAPALKGAARGFDGAEKEVVKQLREDAKGVRTTLAEDILVCTEAQFAEDRAALAPMIDALADAVRRYDDKFFAAKLEEKVLEFSDFEHLALRLLLDENGRKTPLAHEISARFAAVMVDEYQDTNALQDMLYRQLANEEQNNLFLVGDVKQSIYRFRKAMPEIFIEKKQQFAPYDGMRHPAALVLPHNFRSSAGVVDGINDLFGQLMSRAVGEIDYRGGEALIAGAPSDAVTGGTALHVVDITAHKDCGEADYVAALIADMVEKGTLVRDEKGQPRRCNYGDFCILLRSPSGSGETFATALEARGIPACTDTDAALLTLPAVQPLLALLRVLDNPAQDVPLAALLASPMAGFSGADLARIRADRPKGNLWSALTADETAKTQDFIALLHRLRRKAPLLPVAKLCRTALEETGYLLAAQVMDAADGAAGAARLSALRAFISFAADYDAAAAGGLSGFLRSVDSSLASNRAVSAGRIAAPQGVVRLMSIHRSKGLEFPVCILADTARLFNKQDLRAPVLRHTRLGVGMTLRTPSGARYPTLPQMAIRTALEQEQLSEEMRVLYVALTRAKDYAIVTAGLEDPEKKLSKLGTRLFGNNGVSPWLLLGAQNFSQWLLAAAMLHPDGGALRGAAGIASITLAPATGHLTTVLAAAPDHLVPTERRSAVRTATPDEELKAQLTASFGWHDARAALAKIPVKLSVSMLTHRGSAGIPKRPSFMYGEGLSAAERGTALHTLLQYADFAALARDAKTEIARMTDAGYLLAEQAAGIEAKTLASFTASAIFSELCAADRLLREHAFFTEVPAGRLDAALPKPLCDEPVLVQGIADCIFVKNGRVTLLDYKTDHGRTAEQLADDYRGQLALYRQAIEAQLGLPVVRCCLFSFALGQVVEVDTAAAAL